MVPATRLTICGQALSTLCPNGSGEPMMRQDIYDIAKHGTKLGLRMVMAPCGLLVTEELAQKMKDSGIMRVSLSIDGLTAEQHKELEMSDASGRPVMGRTATNPPAICADPRCSHAMPKASSAHRGPIDRCASW